MTSDQYSHLVQQSQEAFKDAVDAWTKTLQDTLNSASAPSSSPQADPQQVVDQVFEFAERMLAVQRDFTSTMVQSSVAAQQSLSRTDDTPPASDA